MKTTLECTKLKRGKLVENRSRFATRLTRPGRRRDNGLYGEGDGPEALAIVDYKTRVAGNSTHEMQLQVYASAGRREGLTGIGRR